MKKLLVLVVLQSLLYPVFSQNYDLIVKQNGDSISCQIDSITETHIYFEMRSNFSQVHTQIGIPDVAEYKTGVIDKKLYIFEPGTSFIRSIKPDPTAPDWKVPKNSVYVGIMSLNYARLIPGKKADFSIAVGLNFMDEAYDGLDLEDGINIFLTAEITWLIGTGKHFFEPGITGYLDFEGDITTALLRLGYRYQDPQGFLFRSGLCFGYLDGPMVLPSISLGYSF